MIDLIMDMINDNTIIKKCNKIKTLQRWKNYNDIGIKLRAFKSGCKNSKYNYRNEIQSIRASALENSKL